MPSRESIHVYYQKAMRLNLSRQASIDQLSDDESASGSMRVRKRRGGYRMESQDSTASRDSMSRYTMSPVQQKLMKESNNYVHLVGNNQWRAS